MENKYQIERRSAFEFDEKERKIYGYSIVFDQMSNDLGYFEFIRKSAVTDELIKKSDIILNYQHIDDNILARSRGGEGTLRLRIDDYGLYFECDVPETLLGNDLVYHLKAGNIDECSFAFTLPNNKTCQRWYFDSEGRECRDILQIDELFDCAIVTRGAYSQTMCGIRKRNKELAEIEFKNLKDNMTEEIRLNDEKAENVEHFEAEIKKESEEKSVENTESVENITENTENSENIEKNIENSEINKTEDATETKSEKSEEKPEEPESENPVSEPDSNENKRNNISTIMETRKFNLLAELRSAYESGRKINLADVRSYTVTAEGEDVVQTDIYDIWEPLRAKNVLVEAGAQYITGIKNNVQIPLMGAVSVNFAGETAAAADGSGTFTNKVLSPKRITAKYPISLELLAQDSLGIEAKVRKDIINAVNAKLEEVLLGDAAGDATKPAGLFNGKTLTKITDFSGITNLEAGIEEGNFLGDAKYIVSPKAKAALRNMPKSAKSTELVMQNQEIDGTPALVTSHVKDQNIVYGDFSNLVIATWDNVQLDVVRDVASVGNGQVTIVVNAFVDAALVRENALAYATTDKTAE